MSTCISIDASTEVCSVSLMCSRGVFTLVSDEPRSHANKLLLFIDELLQRADLDASALDFVACANGPGSFTGIRIAASIAQGLATALDIPLYGVSGLQALALRGVQESELNDKAIVVPLLDARMDEVYWAAFQLKSDSLEMLQEPQLSSPSDVESYLNNVLSEDNAGQKNLLVGPGVKLLSLDQCSTLFLTDATLFPHSNQVGLLASESWERGVESAPESFEICYLRNEITWKKRQKIRRS